MLAQVLREVLRANPKHSTWLSVFENNCQSYGWNSCGCEFFETPSGSAYLQTHGVEALGVNMGHFFGYYLPRKCSPSESEQKAAAAALKAVLEHCSKKGYMQEDSHFRELMQLVSSSASFKGEAIVSGLQELANAGYWNKLEAPGSGSAFVEVLAPDIMPLAILEVRPDGWVMGTYMASLAAACNDAEGECSFDVEIMEQPEDARKPFLPLPPRVAKLGVKGAQLSAMELRLRGGIWRPMGTENNRVVVANAYPPP